MKKYAIFIVFVILIWVIPQSGIFAAFGSIEPGSPKQGVLLFATMAALLFLLIGSATLPGAKEKSGKSDLSSTCADYTIHAQDISRDEYLDAP
jgi:hypothetical protein